METLRIGGKAYKIEFSKERQVLNGVGVGAVIDHDDRLIRFGPPLREIISRAVSDARRTAPHAQPAAIQLRVPVQVSGCFPCSMIPWPHWGS